MSGLYRVMKLLSLSARREMTTRGWLHEAIRGLDHDQRVRLFVSVWAIWYARWKAIHENMFQSPLSTHSFIERFIADLEMATPKLERLDSAPGVHCPGCGS